MRILRLAMAQINCTVGDLEGNAAKVIQYAGEARRLGVDLIAFPELAITGYPPEDLLLKPAFVADNLRMLAKVVEATSGLTAIIGHVDASDDLYNSAAIARDGKLVGKYHKMFLPNYGVFDENRYFQAGSKCPIWTIKGIQVGISICEDIWYADGPATMQSRMGAEVLVNISSSPYHMNKRAERHRMLSTRAADGGAIVCYVNMVGGQDELIFDGDSVAINAGGVTLAEGKQFEEDLVVVDLDVEEAFRSRLHDPRRRKRGALVDEHVKTPTVFVSDWADTGARQAVPARRITPLDAIAEAYSALVLGTRDYMRKNAFKKVVIGLSGGIDSSLVAAVAVDALGPENVVGMLMPSRFTAQISIDDATELANNLGITHKTIAIEDPFRAYLADLEPHFKGTPFGLAEENLQARIRGNLLMAMSNKFGWLVLTTGNKSEIATGYCTLYGDMAGGFAVIKDVPKTLVYKMAEYRNRIAGKQLIPRSAIERVPTAELREGQKDSDSLPLYEVLDPVLHAYVEEDKSLAQIEAMGYPEDTVKRVITLVDRNEYKRRQAAPGIKITPRAFGKDRRLPITNAYRGA
ncbi:MAG: NAD+ synthase [Chloroflexi bacterium]|nr:NAD+ synthase [Chloroflexota bacterium]